MKAQQKDDWERIDAVELSLDELEDVAGGWCTFSNKCSKVINYKKENKNCEYTFYYCKEGPSKEADGKTTYL